MWLKSAVGKICQAGSFALLQGDVSCMRPVFKTINDIGQARAALGQIRRVNLSQVAQANNLGPGSSTGDECFHLLWGQVLRSEERRVGKECGCGWRRCGV